MIEGCPDYHRVITPEAAKSYSVGAVRHTTYFFKWNNDPCNFNEKKTFEKKAVLGDRGDQTPRSGALPWCTGSLKPDRTIKYWHRLR